MHNVWLYRPQAAMCLLALALGLTTGNASAEEAEGNWNGLLVGYHIVVHVRKDAAGHYSATLDSPDQGTFKLPTDKVAVDADHFSFTVPTIGASYAGTWRADQQAWVGGWTQGKALQLGVPLPLVLSRMSGAVSTQVMKRPQEEAIAANPHPYRQREVSFSNAAAGVTLSGTLSLPDGPGPFPAVVLVSGTGPVTRDAAYVGHKMFVVLADALNRRGIAVLRYDKRGVGKSTGDYAAATPTDLAADVGAALQFLKAQPEIAPDHIGLVGHSEGGALAPAVAVRMPTVRFVVLLAGPGMRFDRLLSLRDAKILKASGMRDDEIQKKTAFLNQLYADVETAKSDAEVQSLVKTRIDAALASKIISPASVDVLTRQLTSPWGRQALSYEPAAALSKLHIPVLALNGSLDLWMPSTENLSLIRTALKHNPDATIIELPNLNHAFQTVKLPTPYDGIDVEETFAPAALKIIGDWVAAHGT